ncbi:PQQ-binding-like beta-propeller repeat protein [Phototrophicus methaneseepsis]|uniref:PQQ-binding-like beta-propeller repeat protein n=1 Tax=Phototrophicus methaneseepsis TaxID=2710758 RepID=A0A7S8IDF6_9CHLR|nr:PQQ-binding-like beta-propeller repeat protein [Phototrophicus methaneseepsis]QPC80743.1 PQQ-binding-like beta-propeller repeat protein [Phototrophicus methaneseepsis]
MTTTQHRSSSRRYLGRLSLLALLVVLISAGCVGARIDVSWPALDVVELNGSPKILIAYKDRIDAVDPVNGAAARLTNSDGEARVDSEGNPRLWRIDSSQTESAQQYFANPLVDGETLLFPTYSSTIVPIDTVTASLGGTLQPLPGQVIAPMVTDGDLYFIPIRSQGVVALDPETDDVVWRINSTREGIGAWATPLLVDEVLYVPLFDHYLHAVNAQTGEEIWEPLDLGGGVVTTPLLYEDYLYVGTFTHKLYKISLDGEIVGEYEAHNWIWGTPVAYDGTLYIADLSGYVHAVNPETMEAVWSQRVAERGIRPAPIVTDENVVVASRDGKVYWLFRQDGSLAFEREIDGRPEVLSDMLYIEANEENRLSEDMIVVGTKNLGRLVVAYNLDGRELWVFGR